jgi:hypothetical protein
VNAARLVEHEGSEIGHRIVGPVRLVVERGADRAGDERLVGVPAHRGGIVVTVRPDRFLEMGGHPVPDGLIVRHAVSGSAPHRRAVVTRRGEPRRGTLRVSPRSSA